MFDILYFIGWTPYFEAVFILKLFVLDNLEVNNIHLGKPFAAGFVSCDNMLLMFVGGKSGFEILVCPAFPFPWITFLPNTNFKFQYTKLVSLCV